MAAERVRRKKRVSIFAVPCGCSAAKPLKAKAQSANRVAGPSICRKRMELSLMFVSRTGLHHSDKADSFGACPVPAFLAGFGTSSTASRVSLMPVR